ncbi:dolichyldiphosphatase 1 isoform X1 [Oryx dammah]|uniref:dolichyldiphosphatase 1 isoform X1 n=1 Tax=Oryx dammah TaxID=59534 RepID=UPI001A9BF6F0|nr:dolichyldiphosphatase 1 isoform X1 [Oryx dammah]
MAADGQCSLPASWRPVTLTHVEYPAGDLSGHVLAYLSLSPVFVIVGFVTLIIFKRELHTVSESRSPVPHPGEEGPPHPIPSHPRCFAFPSTLPPLSKCVEPPGWFQVVPGGWEAQSEASRLPRGPNNHTSSRQISFLGGLALNEGVNWLIKHVIQEPRPCGGPHTAVGTKYGMPSSHSQFMWFFSIYSFLFLYLRMHQTNNARFLDLLWRHVLSLGLLTVAFLVSYSRVYLLYHTWGQVLYGGVAGGLMAVAWFVFTQEVLTPLFPRIAAWPISEFFLIRDTSLIPNVLWFEYTVTRAEARNRQRKLGTKLQ